MQHIVYREASVEDLQAILAMERSAAQAPHWSEAAWQASFAGGARRRVVLVAAAGGLLCGFIALSSVGPVTEIENLAVSENSRRRGIGRGLLAAGLDWAKRTAQAERAELEVRASNAAALALYRSLGFQEQGRRGAYYRDPVEEAVLMSMTLR